MVDFFNHLNMLYGTVTEFCNPTRVSLSRHHFLTRGGQSNSSQTASPLALHRSLGRLVSHHERWNQIRILVGRRYHLVRILFPSAFGQSRRDNIANLTYFAIQQETNSTLGSSLRRGFDELGSRAVG